MKILLIEDDDAGRHALPQRSTLFSLVEDAERGM
jgi:hypothetical protein